MTGAGGVERSGTQQVSDGDNHLTRFGKIKDRHFQLLDRFEFVLRKFQQFIRDIGRVRLFTAPLAYLGRDMFNKKVSVAFFVTERHRQFFRFTTAKNALHGFSS